MRNGGVGERAGGRRERQTMARSLSAAAHSQSRQNLEMIEMLLSVSFSSLKILCGGSTRHLSTMRI